MKKKFKILIYCSLLFFVMLTIRTAITIYVNKYGKECDAYIVDLIPNDDKYNLWMTCKIHNSERYFRSDFQFDSAYYHIGDTLKAAYIDYPEIIQLKNEPGFAALTILGFTLPLSVLGFLSVRSLINYKSRHQLSNKKTK